MDPYATHQHVLAAVVAQTHGPIIECGAGDYSTRLLHAMCAWNRRRLTTVERDTRWAARFSDLCCDWHTFVTGDNAVGIEPSNDPQIWTRFHVAFIDGHTIDRAHELEWLLDRSLYVVLHDTEDPRYRYDETLAKLGPHERRDFKELLPWTSVVSRFRLDRLCI